METMENPDGNLDPEDFEYYEFQGTIKTQMITYYLYFQVFNCIEI